MLWGRVLSAEEKASLRRARCTSSQSWREGPRDPGEQPSALSPPFPRLPGELSRQRPSGRGRVSWQRLWMGDSVQRLGEEWAEKELARMPTPHPEGQGDSRRLPNEPVPVLRAQCPAECATQPSPRRPQPAVEGGGPFRSCGHTHRTVVQGPPGPFAF